jgi:hypothetical protein
MGQGGYYGGSTIVGPQRRSSQPVREVDTAEDRPRASIIFASSIGSPSSICRNWPWPKIGPQAWRSPRRAEECFAVSRACG